MLSGIYCPECQPATTPTPTSTRPITTITTSKPNCYPGSTDRRCPQIPVTTTKPRCYPGSTDPQCQPATYLPPTTVTTVRPRCYPGSNDPGCQPPQTTKTPITTSKPVCYLDQRIVVAARIRQRLKNQNVLWALQILSANQPRISLQQLYHPPSQQPSQGAILDQLTPAVNQKPILHRLQDLL